MAKRKKQFPCGHQGFGQICHRCAQNSAMREARREERQEWELTFARDPIDLRALPPQYRPQISPDPARISQPSELSRILRKAPSPQSRRDRLLRYSRRSLTLPRCSPVSVPEAVISHEDYNTCKPGR